MQCNKRNWESGKQDESGLFSILIFKPEGSACLTGLWRNPGLACLWRNSQPRTTGPTDPQRNSKKTLVTWLVQAELPWTCMFAYKVLGMSLNRSHELLGCSNMMYVWDRWGPFRAPPCEEFVYTFFIWLCQCQAQSSSSSDLGLLCLNWSHRVSIVELFIRASPRFGRARDAEGAACCFDVCFLLLQTTPLFALLHSLCRLKCLQCFWRSCKKKAVTAFWTYVGIPANSSFAGSKANTRPFFINFGVELGFHKMHLVW